VHDTCGAITSAAAVASWAEESNGRVEARVFGLAEPLDADAVPSVLRSVGLECLDGIGRKTRFSVSPCPPGWAWKLLFAAASLGGAYSHGSYGALRHGSPSPASREPPERRMPVRSRRRSTIAPGSPSPPNLRFVPRRDRYIWWS
jgi:hypothetical protein